LNFVSSSESTLKATLYSAVGHKSALAKNFRSRAKDGGHTIRSAISENPMPHANLMALSVIEPELWAIEVYISGIGIFYLACSRDLDFDPMTFIYELDPYSLEIYRMCKYELPTSKLSKIIV